jgi:hypothetical protein
MINVIHESNIHQIPTNSHVLFFRPIQTSHSEPLFTLGFSFVATTITMSLDKLDLTKVDTGEYH